MRLLCCCVALVGLVQLGHVRPASGQTGTASLNQRLSVLERDAAFFDQYYFCCNEDRGRKTRVEAVMKVARNGPREADPDQVSMPRYPLARRF